MCVALAQLANQQCSSRLELMSERVRANTITEQIERELASFTHTMAIIKSNRILIHRLIRNKNASLGFHTITPHTHTFE